ncbi:MAG: M1 family metallopeptidase, partial [Ignavibacteria bacterium]|nr:M1 family metallopeptidase [Ignavibacteria bacterium]
ERYFGMPYPYDKLDLIATPENAMFNAMENAGAVTFREDIILRDSMSASIGWRRQLAATIAHELSHMWFGDLVTMAWWDDIWLNESFASWLGDKTTALLFPEYGVDLRQLHSAQYAMTVDAAPSAHAIRHKVGPGDNPTQSFDALSYAKGQAVLSMVEHWVGEDEFRRGILDYLKSHMWRNATASDLWGALSKYGGPDITRTMESFVDQSGLPLIELEAIQNGNVVLHQKRFLSSGKPDSSSSQWSIPIVLKYPDGDSTRTQRIVMKKGTETFALMTSTAPEWIHLNAGAIGYYRWSVPPEMIEHIARNSWKSLNLRERVGFINDLSIQLYAGLVHAPEYLELLKSLADDSAPEVITALVGEIFRFYDDFMVEEHQLERSFEPFICSTFEPALRRFGEQKQSGESESVSLMRPGLLSVLGFRGRHQKILRFADSLARAYMQNPSLVDPAVASLALSLAASQGNQGLFDAYREKFETTDDATERGRYLGALGCFIDSAIIGQALSYVLTGPLKAQELTTIPFVVRGVSPAQRDRVLQWLESSYDAIASRISPEFRSRLVWVADGSSIRRQENAQAFFEKPEHASVGWETEFAKVKDSILRRVRLREREGAELSEYLIRSQKTR